MLTCAEKTEARILLEKLPTEDIEALTETVSARMVTADNRETGLDAILTYSESAKQLLRRKKVKREHIVMYLAEKNQQASHTEDKTSLVKRVLDYWEKNNISSPANDDGMRDRGAGYAMEGTSIVDEYMLAGGHVALPRAESPAFQDAVSSLGPLQVGVTPEGMAVCRDDDGQRLAQSFAPWFYSMLKQSVVQHSLAAASMDDGKPTNGAHKWGAHHFWPDAKLHVFELPDGVDDRTIGAEAVSEKLTSFIVNGFVLEPNYDGEGIKGMMTVNHVISVSVGGGFSHMTDDNIMESGTFEQSFSLVQDNHSSNWRIKTTSLKFMWLVGRATNDPEDIQDEFPFYNHTPTADMPIGLMP